MKPLLSIFLIIISTLTTGCGHTASETPKTGWTSCGIKAADRLNDSLFISYGHNRGAADTRWYEPLESISTANPANHRLRARVDYWKVRRLLRLRKFEEASATLDSALSALDSARYEEDYRRLTVLKWRFDDNLASRYAAGIDNLDYFRNVTDSASLATELMNLGDIMQQVREYHRGAEYCKEASEIWRRLGQQDYADKNLLNVALLSDRHTADSLHRHLLGIATFKLDTAFYELVLRNHYLNTDSVEYLLSALDMTRESLRFRGVHSVNCALMADYLGRKRDFAGALAYADTAALTRDDSRERRFDMLEAHARAIAYHGLGAVDSAEAYLMDYVAIKDSIAVEREAAEAVSSDTRAAINIIDRERLTRAEGQRRMALMLVMTLAIVLLVVCFIFYRHMKMRYISSMLMRQELHQAKSRLSREGILMQEHTELLKTLGREIDHCETEGSINASVSARLRSSLRLYNAARDERQAFLDVHDNMLPGFTMRLKKEFPDLSEKQLRLAAYVCAGMSSGAIARVLNITQSSVMKSRYRLRSKLGLSSDAVLEDFLRRFAE